MPSMFAELVLQEVQECENDVIAKRSSGVRVVQALRARTRSVFHGVMRQKDDDLHER